MHSIPREPIILLILAHPNLPHHLKLSIACLNSRTASILLIHSCSGHQRRALRIWKNFWPNLWMEITQWCNVLIMKQCQRGPLSYKPIALENTITMQNIGKLAHSRYASPKLCNRFCYIINHSKALFKKHSLVRIQNAFCKQTCK